MLEGLSEGHAAPAAARRGMYEFSRAMVSAARSEMVDAMTPDYIDAMASRLLAKASNSFLDATLEFRLKSISPKDLINALARAERLGFQPSDIVTEGDERSTSGNFSHTDTVLEQIPPIGEIRQAQAPYSFSNQARPFTQPAESRAANQSIAVKSRSNDRKVKAVAHSEARQAENDQSEAAYIAHQRGDRNEHADVGGQSSFEDSVSQRICATQDVDSLQAKKEDAMIHMGIRFERKQTGPFEGKLVSQGKIISVDSEDYVEYRVLTKLTF
ncbi:hypothetical protein Daus18300_013928 [Diaporthe australafricana]|uniref:Uncharacterized protein n=1 Tax=Diaporthe australafricana TaxID=127596 RepID=A0ABR3VX67_9PEZI